MCCKKPSLASGESCCGCRRTFHPACAGFLLNDVVLTKEAVPGNVVKVFCQSDKRVCFFEVGVAKISLN